MACHTGEHHSCSLLNSSNAFPSWKSKIQTQLVGGIVWGTEAVDVTRWFAEEVDPGSFTPNISRRFGKSPRLLSIDLCIFRGHFAFGIGIVGIGWYRILP